MWSTAFSDIINQFITLPLRMCRKIKIEHYHYTSHNIKTLHYHYMSHNIKIRTTVMYRKIKYKALPSYITQNKNGRTSLYISQHVETSSYISNIKIQHYHYISHKVKIQNYHYISQNIELNIIYLTISNYRTSIIYITISKYNLTLYISQFQNTALQLYISQYQTTRVSQTGISPHSPSKNSLHSNPISHWICLPVLARTCGYNSYHENFPDVHCSGETSNNRGTNIH